MTAFGIDLGTTNSCIAYVDDAGRPVIVRNAIAENLTPSVVYFERRDSIVVGSAAKNAALLAPDLAVQLVKRQMGKKGVEYTFHGTRYTPETISALILKELAAAAHRQLGRPVRDVVITVPAYFGVAEREATRQAGQIADLNVLDVLAEPVAAALSHQERHPAKRVRHLLVYDLGGGTFDTTVIRVDGDEVNVICTGGDKELGGADWDARVRDYLSDAFTERHPRLDPSADETFMQDLWIKAEQLKQELSSAKTRRRTLRFGGAAVQVEISRQRFQELTADLLDRTLKITEETIHKAARKGVSQFDEVILVGGMTRMPAVAARLEELLDAGGWRPAEGPGLWRHEPDLAVARGAALFALVKQIQQDGSPEQDGPHQQAEQIADRLGISAAQAEAMRARRVTTVVPRGLGMRVIDHGDPLATTDPSRARTMIIHLLPADTPLPADSGSVLFHTALDNQPIIEIEVWEQTEQGSSEELADNTKIGRGRLRGLPPKLPKGTSIQVTFSMNETGLLTVYAVEPGSGREVRFDLQIGGMDRAAIEKAKTAVARHDISS